MLLAHLAEKRKSMNESAQGQNKNLNTVTKRDYTPKEEFKTSSFISPYMNTYLLMNQKHLNKH